MWLLRLFINLIALTILLVSFYYFSLGMYFSAVTGVICALVIFLPRILYYRVGEIKKFFHKEILTNLEVLITTIIIIHALGVIWLFRGTDQYDNLAHFLIPIIAGIIIALAVIIHQEISHQKINRIQIVIVSVSSSFVLAILWEFFEYFSDYFFGTNMINPRGTPFDTGYDLIFDFLSLPVLGVIVYKYSNYFHEFLKKFKKRLD